jgi:hypothetical protein
MRSLYLRLASRHGAEMPFPNAVPIDWTTRSFDFGSAKLFAKTPAPLAFAQDEGIFKTNLSFCGSSELNLKPDGYPLN